MGNAANTSATAGNVPSVCVCGDKGATFGAEAMNESLHAMCRGSGELYEIGPRPCCAAPSLSAEGAQDVMHCFNTTGATRLAGGTSCAPREATRWSGALPHFSSASPAPRNIDASHGVAHRGDPPRPTRCAPSGKHLHDYIHNLAVSSCSLPLGYRTALVSCCKLGVRHKMCCLLYTTGAPFTEYPAERDTCLPSASIDECKSKSS